MAWHRTSGNNGGKLEVLTASGDIASFETNIADVLRSVKCELTPSLTGYTAVNLTANGDTTTIALGDTYYGGTLDVTTGVLTVTHGLYVLDNTATAGQFDINTYTERNRISYVPYQTDGKLNGTFVSDVLTTAPNAPGGIGTDDWQIFGSTTAPRMWITVPTTIATVADFLTYISSNPIKVCYELATPVTVQLSPTAVRAIVGTNNVFADCGSSTVEYLNKASADMYKSIWDGVIPHSNTYIDQNTGNELSSVNWSSTDYLDISENAGLLYRAGDIASSGYGAFYDENKVYVGACNRASNDGSHAIPSGAKYVRLSQADSSFYGLVVIKV